MSILYVRAVRAATRVRALLLALAVGGACVLVGCGAGSSRGHVPRARATGPKILVTTDGGCPRTLGRAQDVRNDRAGLSDRLIPRSARPTGGLVCEYHGSPTAGQPVGTELVRSVRLSADDARRLARTIGKISLKPASGEFACPSEQFGSVAVLVLAYTERTVDLWYSWSGCQTLDNGYVLAFAGANPSFYSGFQPIFDDIAPPPRH